MVINDLVTAVWSAFYQGLAVGMLAGVPIGALAMLAVITARKDA